MVAKAENAAKPSSAVTNGLLHPSPLAYKAEHAAKPPSAVTNGLLHPFPLAYEAKHAAKPSVRLTTAPPVLEHAASTHPYRAGLQMLC